MAVDARSLQRSVGLDEVGERLARAVGGRARGRVIVLFACVLGLEAADQGTIGAVAVQLESGLSISHTQLGLLASVAALIGALVTLPLGVLADRVTRVPVLAASVALWSATMIVSGIASSYEMLLLSRVALGAVIAAASPMLASLIGDLFPPAERARIFAYILTGEVAGTAVGFLVSGAIAAVVGWRGAFLVLALPGIALAAVIWRTLPEPARGGEDRLEPRRARRGRKRSAEGRDDHARRVAEKEAEPHRELVLRSDPVRMPLPRAIAYLLRIRTNVLLIVASGLGYFFLAGVRTFSVVFVRAQYDLGQAPAVLTLTVLVVGAVAGVLVGGRLADSLVSRGRLDGRIVVPAAGYIAAAVIFGGGLLVPALAVGLPLFMLGTAALSATNPPLDATRLDIMHSRLWGRAESVRTTARLLAVAAAPLLFGFIADRIGGDIPEANGGAERIPHSAGQGLAYTFMIMLVPLLAAGFVILRARHHYPRDLATAVASEKATHGAADG